MKSLSKGALAFWITPTTLTIHHLNSTERSRSQINKARGGERRVVAGEIVRAGGRVLSLDMWSTASSARIQEPRIHSHWWCGDRCPLRSEQTRATIVRPDPGPGAHLPSAVARKNGVDVPGTGYARKIFDIQGRLRRQPAAIGKYLPPCTRPDRRARSCERRVQLEHTEYDWSLNKQSPIPPGEPFGRRLAHSGSSRPRAAEGETCLWPEAAVR